MKNIINILCLFLISCKPQPEEPPCTQEQTKELQKFVLECLEKYPAQHRNAVFEKNEESITDRCEHLGVKTICNQTCMPTWAGYLCDHSQRNK